jgi:hypothetical protein
MEMQEPKLPVILQRLAAHLMLFCGTCVTVVQKFRVERNRTGGDIYPPDGFNKPRYFPVLVDISDISPQDLHHSRAPSV